MARMEAGFVAQGLYRAVVIMAIADARPCTVAEVAEWMGTGVMPQMKKGAGASPLFVIDAPNRSPSRGSVPATPGKPIFLVNKQRANRHASADCSADKCLT